MVSLVLAASFAGCAQNDGPNTGQGTTTTSTPPTGTTTTTTTPTSPVKADPTPTISTVLVGTDAAYPPFEDTVGGKIVGFDVDVVTEIANRSGFTVTFQNSKFDAIIPAVKNGQFQLGASAFTITDERKQEVDFSVSYYDNVLMAAVKAGNTAITKADDLRGKKVCTQVGTTAEYYLREQLGQTNDTLTLLDTAPPCAESVKRGDTDAVFIDAAFVRHLVKSSEGALAEAFTVDAQEQFGIVVKKGNTELLVAVNAALVAMKQDGSLQKLKEKWQV